MEGISFQEAVQQAVWKIWDNAYIGPMLFSLQHRVKSDKAQDQLKWHGSKGSMANDIAAGSYKTCYQSVLDLHLRHKTHCAACVQRLHCNLQPVLLTRFPLVTCIVTSAVC